MSFFNRWTNPNRPMKSVHVRMYSYDDNMIIKIKQAMNQAIASVKAQDPKDQAVLVEFETVTEYSHRERRG